MPFFTQHIWMQDATKAWLWVVLTVPTTVLASLIYFSFTRRALKPKRGSLGANGEELNSIDFEDES